MAQIRCILARLRLGPTRHVYSLSHAEGLGAPIDAFIERRSYDNLVRQVVSRLPSGTSPLVAPNRPIQRSVTNSVQLDPKRLLQHCLRELSRLRKWMFVLASRNLTHLVQLCPLKLS